MRLVVFDMDGTLNKTDVYAVEAYRKTLRDLGAGEFSGEEILGRIGAPFEEDFTYFFGEKAEEMKEPFMKTLGYYWDTLLEEKACAFEGVKEMLQNLKAKGYVLAICSNAEEKDILTLGERIGILDCMDYIQPLVKGETKKDSLRRLLNRTKPGAACMVGDRYYDREAARAAGVPFVGCSYGYAPGEVAGADAVAESPLDIEKIVEQLIG